MVYSAYARQQMLPGRTKRKSSDRDNNARHHHSQSSRSCVAPPAGASSQRSSSHTLNNKRSKRTHVATTTSFKSVMEPPPNVNAANRPRTPAVAFSASFRREHCLQSSTFTSARMTTTAHETATYRLRLKQTQNPYFPGAQTSLVLPTIAVHNHDKEDDVALSQLTFSQLDPDSSQGTFPSAGSHHARPHSIASRTSSASVSTSNIPLGQTSFSVSSSQGR